MSLWIDTGLGRYDITTKQGWTLSSIDHAYDSYRRIEDRWWFKLPPELRSDFKQMTLNYYNQLGIDRLQNIEPIFEKPEKTMVKACQYAQACLIRDLQQLYPSLAGVEPLKKEVDEILKVNPGSVILQLSPPGTNTNQFGVSYLDIRDPESAAKILGLLNTVDLLLEYTDHYTLMDQILIKRISEATAPEPD